MTRLDWVFLISWAILIIGTIFDWEIFYGEHRSAYNLAKYLGRDGARILWGTIMIVSVGIFLLNKLVFQR